jgi:hypothetical protein
VPLFLLGPPFFPIVLFGSTTLLTGMTCNSLHMQWPLTSQFHGSVSQREQLVFRYGSNSMPKFCSILALLKVRTLHIIHPRSGMRVTGWVCETNHPNICPNPFLSKLFHNSLHGKNKPKFIKTVSTCGDSNLWVVRSNLARNQTGSFDSNRRLSICVLVETQNSCKQTCSGYRLHLRRFEPMGRGIESR